MPKCASFLNPRRSILTSRQSLRNLTGWKPNFLPSTAIGNLGSHSTKSWPHYTRCDRGQVFARLPDLWRSGYREASYAERSLPYDVQPKLRREAKTIEAKATTQGASVPQMWRTESAINVFCL